MSEQPVERITLLYIGIRPSSKKKKQYLWYELDGVENDGDPLKYDPKRERFYAKVKPTGWPGCICTIEQEVGTESGSVYPNSLRAEGMWANEEDVTRWQMSSRAEEAELERGQKVLAEIKRNLPLETLEPFRQAYRSARNHKQSAFILAQVMEFITGYK